jgi:hypothetical protein
MGAQNSRHLKVFFREKLRGWQGDKKNKENRSVSSENVEERGRQFFIYLYNFGMKTKDIPNQFFNNCEKPVL